MLVTGSAALRAFTEVDRKTVDFDVICTNDELQAFVGSSMIKNAGYRVTSVNFEDNSNKCIVKYRNPDNSLFVIEASLVDRAGAFLETDSFMYYDESCQVQIDNLEITSGLHGSFRVLLPEWQYMMKMSHRYKKNSVHFLKTMQDIQLMRSDFGFSKNELVNPEWFKKREIATYTNKLPNLNVKKDSFFNETVPYIYDHDSIHEAVKIYDRPAYTYYQKDGSEVFCDKNKFFDLPFYLRLAGVIEESYVLALERAVIPKGTERKRAFDIALEKVCTSITSGWFREFAWEHYDRAQAYYDSNFVEKFQVALEAGKILPYKA